MRSALIIAALAALISGCSAWTGPRVAVEDRRIPPVDRPKALHAKYLAPARAASKASHQAAAPALCNGNASHLIHPLHFDRKCPLLRREIRMAGENRRQ
jgi:hypothetical protein